MVKNLTIAAAALLCLVIVSGCSKKNGSPNSVKINGTEYATVVIGSQTWTSVNYNGPGGLNYNNSTTNDPVYGKLYSYTEAEAISLPSGWRLPTEADFNKLIYTLDPVAASQEFSTLADSTGRKLMSATTWTVDEIGTNKTGFNAVGAGFQENGAFSDLGQFDNILTSSKFGNGNDMSLAIYDYYGGALVNLNSVIPYDTDRGSVRFVKDN
ncbi:MAG TPA: FISUMP domain-containing protein [Mucilaginibacter sp.]|jgi:uncharacterized protein (TIGR02145 family)|nr:FISUMP domain-containing protein [Mucilaginibacter sp.]